MSIFESFENFAIPQESGKICFARTLSTGLSTFPSRTLENNNCT